MASPRPLPPSSRDRLPSRRWKRSKICSPTPSLRRGVVPDGRVALPLPRELEGFSRSGRAGLPHAHIDHAGSRPVSCAVW